MIAFRVDVNEQVATGHAMRCLSIAKALRALGESVTFIVADNYGKEFIARHGYPVVCLQSQWNNLEQESNRLISVLQEIKAKWLVVSSYEATEKYLKQLNEHIKVLFIDDLNKAKYDVTVILNYNIYAERLNYKDVYKNSQTNLLLGASYAPLRSQFQNLTARADYTIKEVFISTGGSDNYGFAQKILDYVDNLGIDLKVDFHVVLGIYAKDLVIPYSLRSKVKTYRNVDDMASLMTTCDFAITAGGSTLYELCACGLPGVSYSLSDDQILGVKEFDRLEVIPYCGDIRYEQDAVLQRIFLNFNKLILSKIEYGKISEQMQKLVNGKGAIKIAKLLIE